MKNKILIGVRLACVMALFGAVGVQAQFTGLPGIGNAVLLVDSTAGYVTNNTGVYTNANGNYCWTNRLVAQQSATDFRGWTNLTRYDMPSTAKDLQIQFRGTTVGGGVTNLSIYLARSLDPITNSAIGGASTNIDVFYCWTIPLPAAGTFTLVTNLSAATGAAVYPCFYVQGMWYGYSAGYLTNYSIRVCPK